MEYRKKNKGFGDEIPFIDKLSFGWCFLLLLVFINLSIFLITSLPLLIFLFIFVIPDLFIK